MNFSPVSLLLGLLLSVPAFAESPSPAREPDPEVKTVKLGVLGDILTLPVQIQGIDGCLILDSGSEKMLLRREEMEAMKVKPGDNRFTSQEVTGPSAEMVNGVVEGRIAGMKPEDFPFLSGDQIFATMRFAQGSARPLGQIGMEELRKAKAVIDFENSTLSWSATRNYAAPQGWQELKLVPQIFGKHERVLWGVMVTVGDASGLMIVDSGAVAMQMSRDFAARAKVPLHGSSVGTSGNGESSVETEIGVVPDLVLNGAYHLGEIDVTVIDSPVFKTGAKDADGKQVPMVGILGSDQLRRMKAKIDCAQGKLYGTPGALGTTPSLDIDKGALIHAMYELAAAGDDEAKAVLAEANRTGHLPVGPAQAQAMIERQKARERAAREKE